MYVLAHESSYPPGYSVFSTVYPSLEWAQKALEVKRFEVPSLDWKIFHLSPIEHLAAVANQEVEHAAL